MLTHEEYLIAWGVYFLAASGLFFAFWQMTRTLPWLFLKRVIRVSVMVVLFMPWFSYSEQDYLAPAYLIAAFEVLAQGSDKWSRAGVPMLSALSLAFVLTIIFSIAGKKQ
jgi:hypothetical protein